MAKIMSGVSLHYQQEEIPVLVRDNAGTVFLRIGELFDTNVDIFVENLEQLERFAASIQAQINQLKGE